MKRSINISTWPKVNSKIESALGRFIIAWNMLEQQMDFAIEEVCRVDHDIGSSITANLGTKAKLDIYQSLVHCMSDVAGEDILPVLDRLAADTSNASSDLRNFIVHGQPIKIGLPERELDFWAKFSARKGGVKGRLVRLSAPYIDNNTAELKSLFERWVNLRTEIHGRLEFLDHVGADFEREQLFELRRHQPKQAQNPKPKVG